MIVDYLIGVIDLLEIGGAVISITDVGVVLKCKPAVSFLDLVLGGSRADTQSGVRISRGSSATVRHSHPCFRPGTGA